jgi:hypothetical protein
LFLRLRDGLHEDGLCEKATTRRTRGAVDKNRQADEAGAGEYEIVRATFHVDLLSKTTAFVLAGNVLNWTGSAYEAIYGSEM